ncbi:AAA family ATPase [uncultured Neisseria sp.]|uniref:AAA family ATPase n=1 Tax=uncultured Neisseria sp. TaxID=237778 RepID=UPI0025F6FE9A|nr:AAA family ATPase [uncultured Neisseria sp.]
MNKLEVSIKFKDNLNKISFNLNKNNVFYGNNGKGKTRVLKTIELLYGLAKTLDYNSLISQLDELNLSELTINGTDHSKLFSKYDENTQKDKEIFISFIIENKNLMGQLIELIKATYLFHRNNISFMDYNFIRDDIERKLKRYVTDLRMIDKNPSRYTIEYLQNLISSILHTIIRLRDYLPYGNGNKNYEIEIINLSNYILQKIQKIKFDLEFSEDNIRNELAKEKEKVLTALGRNGARYLTVDTLLESDKIFKKINNIFIKINDSITSNIWTGNKTTLLLNNVDLCKKRFSIFNEIILNYGKINASYDQNGNIAFKKDNIDIDFIKLSSGEKRLCIIFLNIIFAKEDIILIDEPEISLSLDYQNKIIRDIMKISDNKKVMIATHAPYIYEDFIAYDTNEKVRIS